MKAAKFSLRSFFVDCHKVTGWTVFAEVRIAEPTVLSVVLSRQEVAAVLGAVREARLGACLELIYHCGLRGGEAVAVQGRDLHESPHPRLHVRQGKGGHDRFGPMSPPSLEIRFEKVGNYRRVGFGDFLHIAHQLPSGKWTSKLRDWEDRDHI